MERLSLSDDLEATVDGGCLRLSGELRHDNAALLLEWLDGIEGISELVLDEFDIADGIAATQALNVVRFLLAGQQRFYLRGAPQLLAHNLYRTGLLLDGRIVLQAMREDEAYG
jgi:hypothetical protein